MKDFFKRLTAKISKPKTPAKKIPRTKNNTRKIVIAVFIALLAALAAIFYLFQAEIISTYNNIMHPSVQGGAHHATPHHPVSAVSTSSAVASTRSVTAISAVSSSSAVASAVMVSAVSAATSFSPASAIDTDAQMPDAPPVEASTPSIAQHATRPRNRDFRHCLNLKTDAEIAHCAYPK